MIEENLTGNLNGKQEHLADNVVVLQEDIAKALEENELLRLKVVNISLTRENKQLKEHIKLMGTAQVNKAKEESDATNG